MPPVLAIDWNINPLAFLEFFFVIAIFAALAAVEWVARRQDKRRETEKSKMAETKEPPAP